MHDLIVVGSGPGGYAAALSGARRGWRVALIERERWGGVCLNVGCIPTKALLAVAHLIRRIQRADALGVTVHGYALDYAAVRARNERIIATLRRGLTDLLRREQVELIPGSAAFEGPHRLVVTHEGTTRAVEAERFILAAGAAPIPGPWTIDETRVLSYRGLLALTECPTSLLIIGGGAIGCEFAACFSAFGAQVTLVEQQPQLLPGEDPEIVRWLARRLELRGVTVRTGTTIQRLEVSALEVQATLAGGERVTAQHALVAIGQRPNLESLQLAKASVAHGRGITVDPWLRTSQPHIAAIGDCVEGHGLAHWASAEGTLAVRNFDHPTDTLAAESVPHCIFTDPEVASVGISTAAVPDGARVAKCAFGALGKSVCDEEVEGLVKLVVDDASDRILGASIVGANASGLIHYAVLAIHQGLTAKQLARTITAHPTLPESLTDAAASLYGESLYVAVRRRSDGGRPSNG